MYVWRDTVERGEDYRETVTSGDAVDGGDLFLQGQQGRYQK